MRPSPLLLAAVCLAPTLAHADMMPPGQKSLELAIRVDAQVPAGKALVLTGTFRGADVIKPGEDQTIEWHPMAGDMQLRLVAADKVDAIVAARDKLERDAARRLADAGVVCSQPIAGVRTIPEDSPAARLRWTLSATIDARGSTCSSTLVRTEYLSDKGEVVPAPGDANAIPPPSPPPAPPAPPPLALLALALLRRRRRG